MTLILTNARVVTRHEVFGGSVMVEEGRIAAIDAGGTAIPGAIDFEGDYLLAGLIEMHTDNLEKHFMPRPGILWPSALGAAIAHDAQIVAAGITTVLDAICVGEYEQRTMRQQLLGESVAVLKRAQEQGLLRAEHLLHLRCELVDPEVVSMFEPYADHPLVRLVSIMDHTPGQRQWTDVSKFRQYRRGENWTAEQLQLVVDELVDMQARHVEPNRRALLDRCRQRGLPLASHDDTTIEHVAEAAADGITISEFPTTVVAATAARQQGMTIVMGAPNVVRGMSHSGNVSALDLARLRLLDALSSDYVPASLLHAAFLMNDRIAIPLPSAIAMVTANVADLLGMTDRGEIALGRRADLVRVCLSETYPVVRTVWRGGERIN